MSSCSICGKRLFNDTLQQNHRCPPAWEVCSADDPNAWEVLYATATDDAACAWLERVHHGSGVYDETRYEVLVRRAGDDQEGADVTRYQVQMEMVPSYTANRVGTL